MERRSDTKDAGHAAEATAERRRHRSASGDHFAKRSWRSGGDETTEGRRWCPKRVPEERGFREAWVHSRLRRLQESEIQDASEGPLQRVPNKTRRGLSSRGQSEVRKSNAARSRKGGGEHESRRSSRGRRRRRDDGDRVRRSIFLIGFEKTCSHFA